MMKSVAGKVMWVGQATVFLVGLAVILGLVFGVASSALGVNGEPFMLGNQNAATNVSTVVRKGLGPALKLVVREGQAPIVANAGAGTAKNLSADELDGEDSAAFQRRVSGACAEGSSIRSIGADGSSVACEPDDDESAAQVNDLKGELGANDGAPNEATDPVSFSKVKDVPGDVLGRDADTLDGRDSGQFADATHNHSGAQITSGTVAEARVDGALARDSEVMPTVRANDGAASGLDADKLDGEEPGELPGSLAATRTAAGDIQDPLATPETTDTWAFLGGSGAVPQVTTSAGQRIVVQSTAAMGTTVDGGAGDLKLDLCYKSTAADSAVRDLPGGAHVFDVTLLKNQRMPFSLSWTATLPAGTYQVGMCYGLIKLDSAAGWNANDWTRNMVQVYNQ